MKEGRVVRVDAKVVHVDLGDGGAPVQAALRGSLDAGSWLRCHGVALGHLVSLGAFSARSTSVPSSSSSIRSVATSAAKVSASLP